MTPSQRDSPGSVIFINGVPAAGKSTVAAKLRGRMRRPRTVRTDDQVIAVRNSYRARSMDVDSLTLSAESWDRVLQLTQEAFRKGNVLVEGAITERQVRDAKASFGDRAVFVVLRITEETRQRRQRDRDREGRPLATALGENAHSRTGPDEIYDLVIDTETTSAKGCAQEILTFASQRWADARL